MKIQEINTLRETALAEVQAAEGPDALEALRIQYLSRKGTVQGLMKNLKDLDPVDRPAFGQAVNQLKQDLQAAFEHAASSLKGSPVNVGLDITLPGHWPSLGTPHPIHAVMDRIIDIFRAIGFTVADGPEVETIFNNFDALNTPDDHPSRDSQDTFYLDTDHLLRTHTSPVQVRYMKEHDAPVRIIAPGRCYRRDTPDATHSANFHQVEGLYIGRDVSMADLKGDLLYFAREMMGPDTKVRLRPHFFPFTEPSFEVDFYCELGKTTGWLEIAGAGMVDPHVLASVGYNPEEVQGYAFGMGIERIAMILHEIEDIRLLYDNNLRYLQQNS